LLLADAKLLLFEPLATAAAKSNMADGAWLPFAADLETSPCRRGNRSNCCLGNVKHHMFTCSQYIFWI
jgi:hypothetical protein